MIQGNELGKTVHIIPLGHERERATIPFTNRKADVVYLVVDINTQNKEYDKLSTMQRDQERFTYKVVSDLQNIGIDVKIVYANTFNLIDLINTLSKIILLEKENKSNIFMNMSASGRFASVAASISGMAHDIKLYYVHSEDFSQTHDERLEHGVSICNPENIWVEEFVNYRFEMPTDVEISILELLYTKYNTKYVWATTKELSSLLFKKHPEKNFEDMPVLRDINTKLLPTEELKKLQKLQSKVLMRLNGSVMKKLIVKNYAERNDPSESSVRYKITQSGIYALHLSGFGASVEVNDYKAPQWLIKESSNPVAK